MRARILFDDVLLSDFVEGVLCTWVMLAILPICLFFEGGVEGWRNDFS
jgi:hypothetical protein